MQIFVDADACPVVDIVETIAEKYNISTTLLCDTNHILYSDYSEVIVVGAGADAVDYKLISICHKGDVVVSQDYGVAVMALGKGAYAIHRAAGPELLVECRTLHGCETGEAKMTKAYNLPCEYVIHTVGPIWNGGRNREEELLANCYFNSMKQAMDNGIRSIAFPSISTGVYSFPVELAAKIAVHTVNRFLQDNLDSLDFVEWVLFDTHTESVYEAEVDQLYKMI